MSPMYGGGRSARTKMQMYLEWLTTFVTTARKMYQIGRSFGNHLPLMRQRHLAGVAAEVPRAAQDKIVINLGRFFERFHPDYPDTISLFTFLHWLKVRKNRITILDRAAAFAFIGIPDNGQSRPWLNVAVSSKIRKHAMSGRFEKLIDAVIWHRHRNVAHRVAHNKKKAPTLRFDDILALIRHASDIAKVLDGIYLNWRFSFPDPEAPSDTFDNMTRLITGSDDLAQTSVRDVHILSSD